MKRSSRRVAALAALIALDGLVVGCSSDANNADAKLAQQAVGVQPGQTTKEASKETRNVTVIHEDKVVDEKGQVLSDKVVRTPVQVTKETKVETDVKVGEKQTAPK
ncbi:MAG TPA: hypothetical protein VKP69_11185 [Isosphaeraceae bacterium]|nr:hypothetical protein [Isosphaeraceae bacterium]